MRRNKWLIMIVSHMHHRSEIRKERKASKVWCSPAVSLHTDN